MAVSKSWRGLVSLFMFSSGVISALTGIMLYIVPAGRIANWTLWGFLGISKEGWQSIHTNSSLLMLIFGIFHIINNWKPITNYIISKKTGGINQTGNIVAVVLISLLIITGGIFHFPPMSWVMDFGEWVKGTWAPEEYEPPFGHAEELSLQTFCRRMYIDVEAALQALEEAGFSVKSKSQTLSEIASANDSRPLDIYMAIKDLEDPPKLEKDQEHDVHQIEELFGPGSGAGRKSIAEVAEQVHIDVDTALGRLSAAGIDASADSLLKDVKDAAGLKKASDAVLIMLDIQQ